MGLMYFFDTYAFIEILNGNQNYTKYENTQMLTSRFNLMELYYIIILRFGKQKADEVYDHLLKYVMYVDDATIKDAMMFRLANKKKGLSYVDCIGYVIAKTNGLKFLTGDKQFEGMDNVEFVK
ncbi:MAG: PIN domain-containing protein [Candidatus Aenigmarchaeota archaeon]|nr:PIN domain-containing protein [Candidatus Aenigmarchaeota archaeon]